MTKNLVTKVNKLSIINQLNYQLILFMLTTVLIIMAAKQQTDTVVTSL